MDSNKLYRLPGSSQRDNKSTRVRTRDEKREGENSGTHRQADDCFSQLLLGFTISFEMPCAQAPEMDVPEPVPEDLNRDWERRRMGASINASVPGRY